jgi:hypothetical protein
MKRLQHFVLAAGIFGSMLLSSCSQYSVYGTYSFSMGSAKGSHFDVALVLSEYPSTDSAGAEAGRKAFSFDYANVSQDSGDSSSSEASSESEESTSSESSSAVSSETASSSSDSSSNSSGESTSSDSSSTSYTSSHTFVTDANGNLKEMHLTGDWTYYDPTQQSSSASSVAASSSEATSEATTSAETTSAAASSSATTTKSEGQRLDLNFFLLPEDSGTSELIVVPFDITKYFLEVSIVGKSANVVIPVSFNDAIDKFLEIVLEGKDPDSIKIHTVTITLTKEDKVKL